MRFKGDTFFGCMYIIHKWSTWMRKACDYNKAVSVYSQQVQFDSNRLIFHDKTQKNQVEKKNLIAF